MTSYERLLYKSERHYSRLSSSISSPNVRSVVLEPILSFRSSLDATSPVNFATLLVREIPSSSKSSVPSRYAYLEIKYTNAISL